MTWLYLHGFNSDGGGWKVDALQRVFPQAHVLSPDLPADPAEAMALLHAQVQAAAEPPLFIGTSLGGFYAYCLCAAYQRPAYLFNPSLQPHETLVRGIGRFRTWTKGRDYHFRADYLPILAELKAEADARIDPGLLHFFLATDDDVLDLTPIPQQFPTAATLRWYDGAGHAFSKFEKALKEIAASI